MTAYTEEELQQVIDGMDAEFEALRDALREELGPALWYALNALAFIMKYIGRLTGK